MGDENCIEVQWRVEGVRMATMMVASVSLCQFSLECLQETEWRLFLDRAGDNLCAWIRRYRSCRGPDSVGIEWDIRLITEEGEKWNNKKKESMYFKKNEESDYIVLCSMKELSDCNTNLLFHDSLRLSARFWPIDLPLSAPITFYAFSKAGVPRNITWKVEKFSTLSEGEEREYLLYETCNIKEEEEEKEDEEEEAEEEEGVEKDKLLLFLNEENVCVKACSSASGALFVEAVLIQNSDGTRVVCWEEGEYIDANNDESYLSFIQMEKLMSNEVIFLPDDTLTLCFKIKDYLSYFSCTAEKIGGVGEKVPMIPRLFSSTSRTQDRSTSPPPAALTQDASVGDDIYSTEDKSVETVGAEDHLVSLSDDFASLLDKETVSDFALKVGSESIPVHRSVLCARSPVFEAMVTSPMLESTQDFVAVPDFSPDSVRRLVRFLYCGVVPDLDKSNALELYEVSDKYGVLALRERCARTLVSGLCLDTMCDVLSLSDAHSDTRLKEKVLEFFLKNQRRVFRSPQWATFMRQDPVLALEVANDVISKKLDH